MFLLLFLCLQPNISEGVWDVFNGNFKFLLGFISTHYTQKGLFVDLDVPSVFYLLHFQCKY